MPIKEREEFLFQKLREKDASIVADGVICEQVFLNARYKIVYMSSQFCGSDIVATGSSVVDPKSYSYPNNISDSSISFNLCSVMYVSDPPFGYKNFLYYAFLRQNTIYRYKIIISYYI